MQLPASYDIRHLKILKTRLESTWSSKKGLNLKEVVWSVVVFATHGLVEQDWMDTQDDFKMVFEKMKTGNTRLFLRFFQKSFLRF